jgi:hypothetical protein
MKKILIPVETKDRLPDKDGLYRTDNGFTAFKNGRFKSGKYGDVLVWLEEVSEEEYLRQKMEEVMPSEEKIKQKSKQTTVLNRAFENTNIPNELREMICGLAEDCFMVGAKWVKSLLTQEEEQ